MLSEFFDHSSRVVCAKPISKLNESELYSLRPADDACHGGSSGKLNISAALASLGRRSGVDDGENDETGMRAP